MSIISVSRRAITNSKPICLYVLPKTNASYPLLSSLCLGPFCIISHEWDKLLICKTDGRIMYVHTSYSFILACCFPITGLQPRCQRSHPQPQSELVCYDLASDSLHGPDSMSGPSIDCLGAKIASDALDRNQTSPQGVCDRRSVPLSPMERGETYAKPAEARIDNTPRSW
jgi:hypothetical protein